MSSLEIGVVLHDMAEAVWKSTLKRAENIFWGHCINPSA